MKTPFDVKELPLSKLEALGIYHDQQLLLSPSQVQALLAGRRTDLISLHEIKGADFLIERLDARLSLRRQDSGEVELFIHPIYKQPRVHPLLNHQETQELISGKRSFIGKAVEQEEGRSTMVNIEYDPLTKDFVSYDVSKVQAPDRVNGMLLSEEEKSTFRRGEVLELEDGTRLGIALQRLMGYYLTTKRWCFRCYLMAVSAICFFGALLRCKRTPSSSITERQRLIRRFQKWRAQESCGTGPKISLPGRQNLR